MTYGGSTYAGATYAGSGDEQTISDIEMDGVIGAAIVLGPDYFTDADGNVIIGPSVFADPFATEVVALDDLSTVTTTLDESFSRSFNDEQNDVGSGTLSLDNTDSDLALLPLDAMVTFSVYGTRAYSMLVESKHKITLTEGEEHDQITTVIGRGHSTILERAVLFPSRGVGVQPIEEDRTFNWSTPSPVYNDSFWGYAKQICTVGVAQSIWPTLPFAEGWHDLTTGVIWASSGTTQLAPGGDCYFRKDVDVPDDGFYLLEAACDNEGELYLDGQKVIDLGGFKSTFSYSVFITSGAHTVAVHGKNYTESDGGGNGPAGLVVALYALGSDGEPTSMIFHTDNTWKIVAYPEAPPGMFVGKVWHVVWNEALARDVQDFDKVDLMFTTTLDSAGRPWPETLDIASKVGTNYLTFLIELTSTYIDWWMKPGTLELYAWNKGTRNQISGVTFHAPTDGDDPTSGNIYEQTHTVLA